MLMNRTTKTLFGAALAAALFVAAVVLVRLVFLFGMTDTLVEAAARGDRARVHAVLARVGTFGITADLHAPGGPTALMNAAAAGQDTIARDLLAHGANPAAKDRNGDAARVYAARSGHSALARRLAQAEREAARR